MLELSEIKKKTSEKISYLFYLIKRNFNNVKCATNLHDWIYEFEEGKNVATLRYCPNCRRCEKFDSGQLDFIRIKDVSYDKIYGRD